MKKFLTFLLVFAMLLSLPAVSVAAEDTGASDTDSVGETEDTVTGQGDGLKLYGYQNAIVEAGAEKVSVRVIAEVADVDTYKSLCFHVKTAKAEKDYPVTFVYGKLTASLTDGEGATFREELLPRTEGNYLAAVILTDIPVSADAEMTITPCGTRKDGMAVTGDAGTLRKPAGSTEFTTTYQVRFETADGTEISTVSVMRGENATFPTPSGSTYYTADKAEYAKAFNVTANQTITLGTIASSLFKRNANGVWLNGEEGGAQATAEYNADFVSGGWKLIKAPKQDAGAYFTMTGNFAKFEARFWVDPKTTGFYNIYVDDILVREFKLTAGTDRINAVYSVLDSTNMTAGMHTIKVEVVQTAQITALYPTKGPDIKDNYDVTFQNADGSVFTTRTVANGATVTAPETNPTKTGFIFGEWQLNGATYDFSTPVTQDITLTPTWTFDAENYSVVKFTVDGKTYGDEQYIEKGTTAIRPATDPAKDNYAFKFWTVDGETAFDFATPITQDTEIRAYFEATATKHTVTYVDPTGAEIEKVTVVDGENAKLPTAPNGYWWKVNYAQLVKITADKTVTLDKVLQSDYKALNNINNAAAENMQIICNTTDAGKETFTLYGVTLGTTSNKNPSQTGSATFLYETGHYLEFSADFAGSLAIRARCQRVTAVTFTVEVDGYVVYHDTITNTGTQGIVLGVDIPAGEHTVRITVNAIEGTGNASSGFFIAGIYFQEPNTTEADE